MNSSRRVASGGGRISSPSTNQGTSQCQTVHVKEETLKTAFYSWKIDKQDSFHHKTEQNTTSQSLLRHMKEVSNSPWA